MSKFVLQWGGRAIALIFLVGIWWLPRPSFQVLLSPSLQRQVTLDPPQTVFTNDPRLCVHTRLTDEVEEWKIQETLRMVREMGAPTIVEFFAWAYIETAPEEYNWSHADRIVKHAQNQGLTIIARLGLVPTWVNEDTTDQIATLNLLPEEHFPTFAKFVGTFVERYQGQIEHIIIWNEPNLNFEWGNRPPDPIAYTELLKQAYLAAKAANPQVVVMNGALAPTLAPAGGLEGGWNDLDFLRRMYEAGAADYFDALAVHNYPFNMPPQSPPAPEVLNFRRIELWREIMREYGDEDKFIYITETGWNDHPRFQYSVTPHQRIAYTLAALEMLPANYPYVKTLCIWQFRLPAPTNSYPDYFTLVNVDFEPKPIYKALQDYAQAEQLSTSGH
ncbi:MAG: hypothetical protein CUN55_02495 [Phototrophicales bacterium]|nr:MAG: hypothetical protein CUN55_02495 [Phototrophicales bacterium]